MKHSRRTNQATKTSPPDLPAPTPGVPKRPLGRPRRHIDRRDQYATRIDRALRAIGNGTTHGGVCTLVYRLIGCATPALRTSGESRFPFQVIRSHRNRNRTPKDTKPGVLAFHAGNAILGFYDLCNGVEHPGIETAVQHLEAIAEAGYDWCVVDGNDLDGYMLIPKETAVAVNATNQDPET